LADIKNAMKAKEAEKLTVLRSIHSRFSTALLEKKVAKGEDQVLTDQEMLEILLNEAKKRKDSIQSFGDAGRPELAAAEKMELDIIETYLPTQLSPEETRAEVEKILAEQSPTDMGAAMKIVMAELRGKADTKFASEIVKQKFQ